MANTAKPGADLLWAFQLHRENGALSKRLKALESMTTQQQDRIVAHEQNIRSAQDERLQALAKQIQSLQESDVTEQIAGLASELRATRHQVDQARDKVKIVESTSKDIDGRMQERERVVHGRIEGLESSLAQVQRTLLGFEGRLHLAAQHGARIAAEGLEETRLQHRDEMAALSERLSGLQDAQVELRELIEGVVRDWHNAPAITPGQTAIVPVDTLAVSHVSTGALDQTTTTPVNEVATSLVTPMPNPQHRKPGLDEALAAPRVSATAPHTSAIPRSKPTKINKAKPPGKAKKCFDKEIASLINGEGSLTNAPDLKQSQLPLEVSKAGRKKRKEPADEGPTLPSAFTQRETRSQAKRVKEQPPTTRAEVPVKPSKQVAIKSAEKVASKKGTTRQAVNTATTQVEKRPVKSSKRARLATPERPSLLPTSDQIQFVPSRELVESPSSTLASRGKGNGKGKEKLGIDREQQPQQQQRQQQQRQRRRRIKQDDSMEEFLAKCRASTGGD